METLTTGQRRGARLLGRFHLEADDRVPLSLFFIFLLAWAALAIRPSDRFDWFLENLLVFAAIPLLVVNHRRCPLSNVSYVSLAIFFLLHAIGAHYTYAEVPLGRTLGEPLGFERNHFDRAVHFGFGLLCAVPLLEVQSRVAKIEKAWAYLLPIAVVGALSAHYEILEWAVAMVVAPDAGNAYLGTQGDEWDAQKDTLCALAGAVIAMAYACVRDRRRRRPIHADHCVVNGKCPTA